MAELNIPISVEILPQSLRKISRDIKNSISSLSPEFDINTQKLKQAIAFGLEGHFLEIQGLSPNAKSLIGKQLNEVLIGRIDKITVTADARRAVAAQIEDATRNIDILGNIPDNFTAFLNAKKDSEIIKENAAQAAISFAKASSRAEETKAAFDSERDRPSRLGNLPQQGGMENAAQNLAELRSLDKLEQEAVLAALELEKARGSLKKFDSSFKASAREVDILRKNVVDATTSQSTIKIEQEKLGIAFNKQFNQIQRTAKELDNYIANLVRTSGGLKKLSGESLRAARVTLIGIESAQNEKTAREQLTKALKTGRDILERQKQVNLIDEFKKLKVALNLEVKAAKERSAIRSQKNRKQIDKLVARIAANNRKREKERGRLFIASVRAEEARKTAIRKVIVGLNKTTKTFADTRRAEIQLVTEIRKRIAREQKAGRLPTDRGGKAGGAIGGDIGAISGFGQKLNIKEFKIFKTIIAQIQGNFKKLATGERLATREAKRLSIATRELAGNTKKASAGFKRGGSAARGFAAKVGRATQTVLAFAGPTAIIFGMINAIKQAVSVIIELDFAARRLVFFEKAGPFVQATNEANNFVISAKEISLTMDRLFDTSIRTGLALGKVTEALTTVTRIGQKADGQFAKTVLSLLKIEGGSLSAVNAVRLLNAVQIQFLNTLEKFDKGIASSAIKNVGNLIAITAAQSAFNVEQLTNALTRIGPALTSLQDTNVNQAIVLIGKAANVTGADVGRLSTTLRQLTTLVIQNAAEIKKTSGIEILGGTGQIKGFSSILDFLEEINRLSLAGSAKAVELALQGADRRNVASVLALAQNVKELRKAFEDAGNAQLRIQKAGKAAIAVFEIESKAAASIKGRIEALKSAFDQFIESPAVTKFLTEAINTALEFIQVISRATAALEKFFNVSNRPEGGGKKDISKVAEAARKKTEAETKKLQGALDFAFVRLTTAFGAVNPPLAALLILIKGQRELNDIGRQSAEIMQKNAKIDAEITARDLIAAEKLKAAEKEKQRLQGNETFNKLTREILAITKKITTEELRGVSAVSLRFKLEDLIAKRKELIAEGSENAFQLQRKIATLQQNLLDNRRKEELTLIRTEAIQDSISGFLSKAKNIEVKFEIDKSSIKEEIDAIDKEIKKVVFEIDFLGRTKESDEAIKAVEKLEELKAKRAKTVLDGELLILKERKDLTQSAAEEFKTQIDVFEKSSQSIINAFTQVISLQKGLANLLSQQGSLVVSRIQNSAKAISAFLEVSGASVEVRLRSAQSQANVQIAAVKRIGDAQLRALRAGIDTESFIDIDDLQTRTDALIGIIRTGIQAVARVGESEQKKQTRELFNQERKIRVDNAKAEFTARISAARNEIEVRKNILSQEINIIKQRIQAERALNEIRKKQQEEFGRLLIQSPEKFKESINDIRNATKFFRGVTDINIGGLEQIFNRIKNLRQAGGTEALQSVLRGIQAGGQFGKEIAPGIGSKQLQSAFERLQLNLPRDVKALFESQAKEALLQTELQKKIELRNKEQERLAKFNFKIQESQLKIAIAEGSIAQGQRNKIIRAVEISSSIFEKQFGELTTILTEKLGKEKGPLGDVNIGSNKEFKALFEETKNSTDNLGAWSEALRESKKIIQEKEDTEPERIDTDTINTDAIKELSQKLRPLSTGRLQVFDPAIPGLREEIKKTGGTREERNRLRRLVAESRRTIGGGSAEAQGRKAAGRFLKDDDIAKGVNKGFRGLLQDLPGGRETKFVTALRKFDAQRRVDPSALRDLLAGAGLSGTAAKITTRGKAEKEIDKLLKLSDKLSENQGKITREAAKEIGRLIANEITQGIRDIKEAAGIGTAAERRDRTPKEDIEERKKDNRDIVEALKGFSIGNVEFLDDLKSTLNEGAKEIEGRLKAAFAVGVDEVGTIKISISSPEIEHKVNITIANSITSESFAQTLAIELAKVGISRDEINKLVPMIQSISEPLIKAGVITRPVPGPTSAGPF